MAFARKHPFLAPALLTTAVLVAVLLLPISFDRTVAHDISMKLEGGALDPSRVAALGREIQSQLGAKEIALAAEAEDGAAAFTLTASVPAAGGARAQRVVEAFESALEKQGISVTASVTPRTERVSGTVAAYAADRVIRIETEGKSAEQIGAEIRTALEQAGLTDVQVSVSDEGNGAKRVEVRAERDANAGDPPAQEMPQIVLGDESPGSGDRVSVQVRKLKDESGAHSLKLSVTAQGRDTEVTVPNIDSMSDGALESEIERQLSAAGLNHADVTVTNGKIDVQVNP
jgi:hypothetical protein